MTLKSCERDEFRASRRQELRKFKMTMRGGAFPGATSRRAVRAPSQLGGGGAVARYCEAATVVTSGDLYDACILAKRVAA
jgi:hypothetical protein